MTTMQELFPTGKAEPTPYGLTRALCVDPGLTGTGWAFWNVLRIRPHRDVRPGEPDQMGLLTTGRGSYEARMTRLVGLFGSVVAATQARELVLESPEVWGGSSKSYASATSGDLLKLVALVGAFHWEFFRRTGEQPVLVTPTRWKGGMPKDTVMRRIARAFGKRTCRFPDHIADAVGMGLAVMGRL